MHWIYKSGTFHLPESCSLLSVTYNVHHIFFWRCNHFTIVPLIRYWTNWANKFYIPILFPYPFLPILLSLSFYSYPIIPIPLSLSLYPYLYGYCANIMQLLCNYCGNILQILCKYCVNIEQIFRKYCTNIIQILFGSNGEIQEHTRLNRAKCYPLCRFPTFSLCEIPLLELLTQL